MVSPEYSKALSPILVTELGIVMVLRFLQNLKVYSFISVIELDKVTFVRFSQPEYLQVAES